jgi:hypothetical protein
MLCLPEFSADNSSGIRIVDSRRRDAKSRRRLAHEGRPGTVSTIRGGAAPKQPLPTGTTTPESSIRESRGVETSPQLLATTWGTQPWFLVGQIDAGKLNRGVEDGREEGGEEDGSEDERWGMKR